MIEPTDHRPASQPEPPDQDRPVRVTAVSHDDGLRVALVLGQAEALLNAAAAYALADEIRRAADQLA